MVRKTEIYDEEKLNRFLISPRKDTFSANLNDDYKINVHFNTERSHVTLIELDQNYYGRSYTRNRNLLTLITNFEKKNDNPYVFKIIQSMLYFIKNFTNMEDNVYPKHYHKYKLSKELLNNLNKEELALSFLMCNYAFVTSINYEEKQPSYRNEFAAEEIKSFKLQVENNNNYKDEKRRKLLASTHHYATLPLDLPIIFAIEEIQLSSLRDKEEIIKNKNKIQEILSFVILCPKSDITLDEFLSQNVIKDQTLKITKKYWSHGNLNHSHYRNIIYMPLKNKKFWEFLLSKTQKEALNLFDQVAYLKEELVQEYCNKAMRLDKMRHVEIDDIFKLIKELEKYYSRKDLSDLLTSLFNTPPMNSERYTLKMFINKLACTPFHHIIAEDEKFAKEFLKILDFIIRSDRNNFYLFDYIKPSFKERNVAIDAITFMLLEKTDPVTIIKTYYEINLYAQEQSHLLSFEELTNFADGFEEYKEMPVSWWLPLVKEKEAK